MYNLTIINSTQNNVMGRWEYDINKDAIILSVGAAGIYYNESCEKKVAIDEFFRVLSAKSSQCLSDVLTDTNYKEIMFFQQVLCTDGTCKKVLVIILESSGIGKNKQALSVDVTKIL